MEFKIHDKQCPNIAIFDLFNPKEGEIFAFTDNKDEIVRIFIIDVCVIHWVIRDHMERP